MPVTWAGRRADDRCPGRSGSGHAAAGECTPVRHVQARLALTAGATFVARCVDSQGRQLRDVLIAAAGHRGAVLVESWQNCPVFNDGAFAQPSRDYLHCGPLNRLPWAAKASA